MILTPSLGSLARLWSVSYSYDRLTQGAVFGRSLDVSTFQSFAGLAFEVFQKCAFPALPSLSSQETARSILTASLDSIRKWERALAHRVDQEEELAQVTTVALAARDRMIRSEIDEFSPLRPKEDDAPTWVREIVLHGGIELFGDGTSPLQVNEFSSLTGIPPWMVPAVLNPAKAPTDVISSIFSQSPAEIGAQCAWVMEGFRSRFGDAFVTEALQGYRKLPSVIERTFWENVRASGYYEKMIFSGTSTKTPQSVRRFSEPEENGSTVRFALENGDLKGRKARSLEIAPVLVVNETRSLKINLVKLGLGLAEREALVTRLWEKISVKDMKDLASSLISKGFRDDLDVPYFFDLESASLRIFLERKIRQKALRRNPERYRLLPQ